ncbi:MAG TPA: SelB C-terminal domain-containing protein [Marmoricola sp.]|nr:SelB C-terminal domain-containing protein [Marmoricola sp.]
MHVIATAGHVDHGKSTLVQALTGSDPDRLAEERSRGLTIELGYAWTALPSVGEVAFVDVPGHERFVSTMLSGIGPVPAVLLVVAADDPWMPQAAEHLAALDALAVGHGVVAVTRSDLADPAPMVARARHELASTSLAGSPVVPVSGATGMGLDELRQRLVAMLAALPAPDPSADVRLWLDRSFHVKGAGTVVTGTLPAGRIRVGDVLAVGERTVRVRGVQSLGRPVDEVSGVARVALNLSGEDRVALDRHSVLTTPSAWHETAALDVRLTGPASGLPRRPLLHIGAVAVPSYSRPLADDLVRLTLERPLPLRVGDRALLRDPGSRVVWGVTVLDPAPPALGRRGAARARADELRLVDGTPSVESEVRRRGAVHVDLLRRIGVPSDGSAWLVSEETRARWRAGMRRLVEQHHVDHPLDAGVPLSALASALGAPDPELLASLVEPPLVLVDGRVSVAGRSTLPPEVAAAVSELRSELAVAPFAAPTADRLRAVGLSPRAVSAAAKAGELLHLGDGIVLLPDAADRAIELLRELPQPFTTSEARTRLGTSRRVALPLLQHLDRRRLTRRLPDDRRTVNG